MFLTVLERSLMKQVRVPMKDPRNYHEHVPSNGPTSQACTGQLAVVLVGRCTRPAGPTCTVDPRRALRVLARQPHTWGCS
jgi:hypothetical protein